LIYRYICFPIIALCLLLKEQNPPKFWKPEFISQKKHIDKKTMVAIWYSPVCVNRVSASSPPTTTKYENKIWRPWLNLKRII
jgi:hypothetical protein